MTTASLHREMVEALREADELLVDWWNGCDGTGKGPLAGVLDDTKKLVPRLRAALEGWEKREPLRDDEDAIELVRRGTGLSRQGARHLLGTLEPLLYGERG